MKEIIKRLRSQSVLRYVIAFSGIVVLIVLVMGGYLYYVNHRSIYQTFLSANTSWLESVEKSHENDMRILDDVATQISLSADIAEFVLADQPQKSIKLKERLHQYITVSQFFTQILYQYHEDDYLYNHSTSIERDLFLTKGLLLEKTTADQLSELLFEKRTSMAVLPEQKADGYVISFYLDSRPRLVTYVKPVAPRYMGTLAFLVKDTYYDDLLSSQQEEKRYTCILYENQLIVGRGSVSVEETELTGVLAEAEEQQEVKLGGEHYLLTQQKGDSGLWYCTLQSMSVFHDQIMSGLWAILFLLVLCSVPAAVFIAGLSRKVSGKVHDINVLLNEENDPYNVDQIEQGIRSLVEINREKERASIPLHRTRFIRFFVRNEFADRTEAVQAAQKAQLQVDCRWYVIVLMGDGGNSNESKAHDRMLKAIAADPRVDGYGMRLLSKNQSLFALFSDEKEAIEELMAVLLHLGHEFCENFIMSVSSWHEDFSEASKAYLEADTAFDNRFLMDNSQILHFQDVATRDRVEVLPEIYQQRLKHAIRAGNEEALELTITEICDKLKRENQSLLTFRILCNDMLHLLVGEVNEGQAALQDISSVFVLSQCQNIHDFHDILSEGCRALMSKRPVSESKKSDMIASAVAYMKENFQSPDLNMTSLAEYLEISPVTLAVEFKNGVGMSPSDYLAVLRLERAKQLLRETTMLVKEVSQAVGYEDDHVFMRRFKKYVGMTPGQYRNLN
ncbi:MAG: helix-turn-helix transcriptional regulator [Lachnospiraceae bacterium]|nr:helix-turn-helix transcriptional regulator [Lachnospiraceae bacterium]